MDRHDEEREPAADTERGTPDRDVADATIDTGVAGAGDDHLGLEGTRDVRPHSAREDLRLT